MTFTKIIDFNKQRIKYKPENTKLEKYFIGKLTNISLLK